MHHSFIDKYSDGTSAIHRFDVRLKIVLSIATLICILSTPQAYMVLLAGYAALILLGWWAAHLPWKHLAQRIGIALPFVALIALGTLIAADRDTRVLYFFFIVAKAALAIGVLSLLTSTTRFPQLLDGFAWFGAPRILTAVLAFLYRYLFILLDEGERLSIGRRSRQLARRRALAWKSRAWMVGTLFLRSLERSERVYHAMLARGFSGSIRREAIVAHASPTQIAWGLLLVASVIAIRAVPALLELTGGLR